MSMNSFRIYLLFLAWREYQQMITVETSQFMHQRLIEIPQLEEKALLPDDHKLDDIACVSAQKAGRKYFKIKKNRQTDEIDLYVLSFFQAETKANTVSVLFSCLFPCYWKPFNTISKPLYKYLKMIKKSVSFNKIHLVIIAMRFCL